MSESINSRIRLVRKELFDDSNKKFAEVMGEKTNTVNNWAREGYSVGRGVLSKISSKTNVDLDWLLTGKGIMLPENIEQTIEPFYKQNPNQSVMNQKLLEETIAAVRQHGDELEHQGQRLDMILRALNHFAGVEDTQRQKKSS